MALAVLPALSALTVIAGAAAVGLGLAAAGPALAQGASTRSATGLTPAQQKLLDGRLARQYEHSNRLLPDNGELPRYTGSYRGRFYVIATAAARKHGVPEDLFARLVERESRWRQEAISPKGAIGLAQLMPDTARRLGVDPHDPVENLEGGARYLRQMFLRFRSWRLALAAYNAGPEAVVAAGNAVPDYAETKDYVAAILGR